MSASTVTVVDAVATPNGLVTTQLITAPSSAAVNRLVMISLLAPIGVPFLSQVMYGGWAAPTVFSPSAV